MGRVRFLCKKGDRVRILSRIESGFGFYWCSPDYINQNPGISPDDSVVRLRVLSFFSVRVRVWILFNSSPDSTNNPKSLTFSVIITQ